MEDLGEAVQLGRGVCCGGRRLNGGGEGGETREVRASRALIAWQKTTMKGTNGAKSRVLFPPTQVSIFFSLDGAGVSRTSGRRSGGGPRCSSV